MKKILLATTVLAVTAGFAAADVTFSGSSARMGISQAVVGGKVKSLFSSRVRIGFAATGTTDGGLSFGANMRADQSGGNSTDTQTTNGSSTVFISGAFGKITMGDVAGGAGDELVGQVAVIGYSDLSDTNAQGDIGFLGNAATAVRYDYTSGALSVAIGASQTNAVAGTDNRSIAVKYATDTWSVALSHETVKGNALTAFKGTYTMGALSAQLKVAKQDNKVTGVPAVKGKTEDALSLSYAVSPALSITAFYANHANTKAKAKGIGATYDLGGGAKVMGAVVNSGITGDKTVADVGVVMSF